MRTTKNEASVTPSISIEGGGKTYNVKLIELAEFFNECENIGMKDLRDLEWAFEDIADLVVNGASDGKDSLEETKRLYNFVKHLRFLFKSLVDERHN